MELLIQVMVFCVSHIIAMKIFKGYGIKSAALSVFFYDVSLSIFMPALDGLNNIAYYLGTGVFFAVLFAVFMTLFFKDSFVKKSVNDKQ